MRKLKLDELGRKSLEAFKNSEKTPVVILLDNIRSLNNIGSFFRTADAFALEKIFLTGFTATPPHREIHKTALGATESVAWEYYAKIEALLNVLKKQNYFIVAAEQTDRSVSLEKFCPPRNRKIALIFGNEVKGVSDEALNWVDAAVEIPQFGTKHSFNVSVSAGIVLWDIFAKLKYYKLCE